MLNRLGAAAFGAAVVLLTLLPGNAAAVAAAPGRVFTAALTGGAEVPPVSTGASGATQVVISADGPHRSLSPPALVNAVCVQLRGQIAGLSPDAVPMWSKVITERRATHACTPGRAHPVAGHLDHGVYLAGDHTDADYPGTLEAAVRSGIRAARAVLARR